MQAIDVCNGAIDLIGQGRHIKAFDRSSPESELCSRLYPQILNSALDFYNWSFARKDEIITNDYLLPDVVSKPYEFSYRIDDDVLRILFLTELNDTSRVETVGYRNTIQFNFRNFNGQKILVTNQPPDFVMHYQAYIDDVSIASPSFVEALQYLLAGRLAPAIIKGQLGVTTGQSFTQLGLTYLNVASGVDAQQGGNSVEQGRYSKFTRARR